MANTDVHYIQQPIADVLSEAELFGRFVDGIIWITASEMSNGVRQALTSAFANIVDWNCDFAKLAQANKQAKCP